MPVRSPRNADVGPAIDFCIPTPLPGVRRRQPFTLWECASQFSQVASSLSLVSSRLAVEHEEVMVRAVDSTLAEPCLVQQLCHINFDFELLHCLVGPSADEFLYLLAPIRDTLCQFARQLSPHALVRLHFARSHEDTARDSNPRHMCRIASLNVRIIGCKASRHSP
eukprot:6490655-Amphidinium_carterae.2